MNEPIDDVTNVAIKPPIVRIAVVAVAVAVVVVRVRSR
jgi:hypothetical protein